MYKYESKLGVIPYPVSVIPKRGRFLIDEHTGVYVQPSQTDILSPIEILNNKLNLIADVQLLPAERSNCKILFTLMDDEDLGKEGYVLTVDASVICVKAMTSEGLFYGAQTLAQMMRVVDSTVEVRAVELRDVPAMSYRGVLADISRGQRPTLEFFKKMIDILSSYKINVLMFYIEDMFKFKSHPAIGEGRGALSRKEVEELDHYARARNVMLLPGFQSFSHVHNILKLEPYSHLGEIYAGDMYCPIKEEVYELLGDLYSEILPAFSSPLFSCLGDETWTLGTGESREAAEEIGVGALYINHIRRLYDLVKAHGKRLLVAGDMFHKTPHGVPNYAEVLKDLPRDIIIINWEYNIGYYQEDQRVYPAIDFFKEYGFEQIVMPSVSNWCRLFPNLRRGCKNIKSFIRDGYNQGVLGQITAYFGDDGADNFPEHNWYGLIYAAEYSWNMEAPEGYSERFSRAFYGCFHDGIARAIDLLTESEYLIKANGVESITYALFWEDPFTGRYMNLLPRLEESVETMREYAYEAEKGLVNTDVLWNKDDIDYLKFACARVRFLYEKVSGINRVRELYTEAYQLHDQRSKGLIDEALEILNRLVLRLSEIKQMHSELWLRHYVREGLVLNLGKYDKSIATLKAKYDELKDITNSLDNSGLLPEPKTVDLDARLDFMKAAKEDLICCQVSY